MSEISPIRGKTITGLVWSFIDLFASQGIQFIVLMILARLLAPEFFGLIGMVVVFIAISNSLIDSGLTQALIREKDTSQVDYSTVFFFNLFISVLLTIILYSIAPMIGHFFGNDQLSMILRVLSFTLIINSLGIIQRVMLTKKINFKTQTKINLASTICAGIVASVFAFLGFGVWSLVAQTITLQTMQTLLLWISNKWVPSLVFSMASFKRLFSFAYKLLISSLLDTAYNNVFSLLIGKLYSAGQLGFYTNANKLKDVITNSATSAIQRVTYPVLSSIQDDENHLQSAFRKIIRTTAFIMFPMMMGLIAIADTLIPILLGPAWTESIVFFQLLCLIGMIYPIHAINLNILQVKGRSDLFLKLEIIKKILITVLIAISLFFSLGILGLIGAAIISSYVSLLINAFYSAKEIDYSSHQQLKDMALFFLLASVMGISVYFLGTILALNLFFKLVIQILFGMLIYIALSWGLKNQEFKLVLEILLQLSKKTKKNIIKAHSA